jgi:hypothetical protein
MIATRLEFSDVFVAIGEGKGALAMVHAQRVMMASASDDDNDTCIIVILNVSEQL